MAINPRKNPIKIAKNKDNKNRKITRLIPDDVVSCSLHKQTSFSSSNRLRPAVLNAGLPHSRESISGGRGSVAFSGVLILRTINRLVVIKGIAVCIVKPL